MRRWINVVAGTILALPVSLWCASQVGAFVGFDFPPLPAGSHLVGPAAKGTLTFTVDVNTPSAFISFEGKCGNVQVSTGAMNVSQFTDEAAFLAASGGQVENVVENVNLQVTSFPTQLGQFTGCYGSGFLGVYVTAVNKTLSKTNTPPTSTWVGEVTLQGFRF